ncbi:LPS export ABC transporter permease LptF [Erwinia sp. S38]|uniref:LPS export ABC transporter permease LptF n=1 Tax=Erwinia sp. S38 TaxID=2769338 RepID=UPI00190C3D5B|nr:LPS export ABC transporter permease LptF [Erwinia sp. S38]MBK0002966.1 LPS export ABC transporter permease LptF [Erwinia sp. S38]
MYLIERYIMVATQRLVITIIGFLIFIFASYSTQRYLTDAANGTLALQSVMYIVFYKILIALEMLLPVGLYVSVAVALGQLYNDSEITAVLASGISPFRIYKAIMFLAIPLGILVTLLSMYARPWAYEQIFQLKQQAQSELDVSHLQEKKFNLNDSGRMILSDKIDRKSNLLSDVLIYSTSGNNTFLFRAHSVKVVNPAIASPAVMLHSGTAYQLDRKGTDDNVQTYKNFNLHPKPMKQSIELRSKSASMAELSRSHDPADIAERQWRESRGISAILMALLAIPLSRTRPRQGRFATLVPLAVLFVLIFYAGNISRSLVASDIILSFPGVWTVPLMMLLGFLGLLAHQASLLQKFFR